LNIGYITYIVAMNLLDQKIHQRILTKKTQLDQHRPLSNQTIKKLHETMEIAYTYNSNAIEGNTLTLNETRLVIQEGITIKGKSLSEHLEAKNHPNAITYIENLAKNKIQEQNILELHSILFTGFCENTGNYRNCQVYISGSDFMPPPAFEIPELMRSLLDWVSSNPQELRPIELAAIFHYKLVAIHPFDDGNGRVGRLLMNLLLLKNGYPLTVIRQVDRKRYYDCLKRADNQNYKPLVGFVARCVEQSLDMYLQAVLPTNPENKLLTLKEAAKNSPYSQEYLSLLARKGQIAAVKVGRNWKITKNSLEEYTNKNDFKR
jgi:excisionase family DNA binding protein